MKGSCLYGYLLLLIPASPSAHNLKELNLPGNRLRYLGPFADLAAPRRLRSLGVGDSNCFAQSSMLLSGFTNLWRLHVGHTVLVRESEDELQTYLIKTTLFATDTIIPAYYEAEFISRY